MYKLGRATFLIILIDRAISAYLSFIYCIYVFIHLFSYSVFNDALSVTQTSSIASNERLISGVNYELKMKWT
jgi:hypothetical protein